MIWNNLGLIYDALKKIFAVAAPIFSVLELIKNVEVGHSSTRQITQFILPYFKSY